MNQQVPSQKPRPDSVEKVGTWRGREEWVAYDDEGFPRGRGYSEAEAIADFEAQMEEVA